MRLKAFSTLWVIAFLTLFPVMAWGVGSTDLKSLGHAGDLVTPGKNTNRHNFSINRQNRGGETLLKANDPADPRSTEICIYCHTPHGATPQSTLWNRNDPAGGPFSLYGRPLEILIDDDLAVAPSAQYGVDYPNGATKFCLSCHDGVSAVGDMAAGTSIQMSYATMNLWVSGGGDPNKVLTPGGNLDLQRTHPLSFFYTSAVASAIYSYSGPISNKNGCYKYPDPGDRIMLDSQERMQCTTCHNPHLDTNNGTYTLPFWRKYTGVEATDYDAVCGACHIGGYTNTIRKPNPGNGHNY